jgi:hypothetical protein
MRLFISRNAVVKSPRYNSKMGYVRLAIPPDNIDAEKFFADVGVEGIRKMSGDEIRRYLRAVCRLPISDSKGNAYAYRIFCIGQGYDNRHMETLFPRVDRGERVGYHGRLDYNTLEFSRRDSLPPQR